MKALSFAGASVAGIGLFVAIASSSATNANPRPLPVRVMREPSSAGARPQLRPRPYASPAPCSTNYPADSFVGFSGQGNVAGAKDAGVLAGLNNKNCGEGSAIGAGSANTMTSAGGLSFIGGGAENMVSQVGDFIGGGYDNSVSGGDSSVGAGTGNVVSGANSFIGGGEINSVSGDGSFIGGGNDIFVNTQEAMLGQLASVVSGDDSFIGAGDLNNVAADESFVGAGKSNTIASAATFASILGGASNTVSAEYGSILGGFGNSVTGEYGIVAGGDGDTAAGILSFAAGYHATAAHNGSFVWSDYSSGSATLKDTAANQFVVRASGGVDLYSNEAATAGVVLSPGSGTWASLSDRNAKTGIVPLDAASVLAKVVAMPVSSWQYKSEPGVRHLGPLAQEFYAAFGVGVDDRHITSIDEDGVALAAIKSLSGNLDRLRAGQRSENARKDAVIGKLRKEVRALDAMVAKLVQGRLKNGHSS